MDFTKLSVIKNIENIKDKKISCEDLILQYIKKIEENKEKKAVAEVFSSSLERAKEIDKKIAKNQKVGKLAGAVLLIKDNILYENHKMTCASHFLKDFISPYSASIIQKLMEEDAIILGRTNMEEFSINDSNNKSDGSAMSVNLSLCGAAISVDAGGSIILPAHLNGVIGMKPTKGRISRYGITASSSSFDQVGTITKSVKDSALLLNFLSGYDSFDQTTCKKEIPDYLEKTNKDTKNLKIGVIKQVYDYIDNESKKRLEKVIKHLKSKGVEIVEINYPYLDMVLPIYEILASAEFSSNLGRFDGIKYSTRSKFADTIEEVYRKSRSEGFGKEVKERIMLGNYFLLSENFDVYYNKARKAQSKLTKEIKKTFLNCDAILLPMELREKTNTNSQIKDLEKDVEKTLVALASITGLPSLSIFYDIEKEAGLINKKEKSVGIQIICDSFNEQTIYNIASMIETENLKEIQ